MSITYIETERKLTEERLNLIRTAFEEGQQKEKEDLQARSLRLQLKLEYNKLHIQGHPNFTNEFEFDYRGTISPSSGLKNRLKTSIAFIIPDERNQNGMGRADFKIVFLKDKKICSYELRATIEGFQINNGLWYQTISEAILSGGDETRYLVEKWKTIHKVLLLEKESMDKKNSVIQGWHEALDMFDNIVTNHPNYLHPPVLESGKRTFYLAPSRKGRSYAYKEYSVRIAGSEYELCTFVVTPDGYRYNGCLVWSKPYSTIFDLMDNHATGFRGERIFDDNKTDLMMAESRLKDKWVAETKVEAEIKAEAELDTKTREESLQYLSLTNGEGQTPLDFIAMELSKKDIPRDEYALYINLRNQMLNSIQACTDRFIFRMQQHIALSKPGLNATIPTVLIFSVSEMTGMHFTLFARKDAGKALINACMSKSIKSTLIRKAVDRIVKQHRIALEESSQALTLLQERNRLPKPVFGFGHSRCFMDKFETTLKAEEALLQDQTDITNYLSQFCKQLVTFKYETTLNPKPTNPNNSLSSSSSSGTNMRSVRSRQLFMRSYEKRMKIEGE